MKRFLVILLLAAAVLAGGGWYFVHADSAPKAYTPLGPGDVYLGLGDSLAAGWNAEPGKGYVERLGARLRQQNPQMLIRNMAIPGETSGSFDGQQLPQGIQFIKAQQAAGKRISPITLTIGGNDARNAEHRPDAERRQVIDQVGKNLATGLDQLLAATKGAHGERTSDIVVMTYYNPWGGDPKNARSPAYWAAELNAMITKTARARGIPVADVATPFENGRAFSLTFITTGDIHANNAGHQLIADQFWQALQYK